MTQHAIVWALERAAQAVNKRYAEIDPMDASLVADVVRDNLKKLENTIHSLIATLPAEWEQQKAAAMHSTVNEREGKAVLATDPSADAIDQAAPAAASIQSFMGSHAVTPPPVAPTPEPASGRGPRKRNL